MSIGRFALVLAAIILSTHLAPVAAAPSIEGIWDPAPHPARMGQPLPEDVKLTPEGRAELESFSMEKDPTLRCIMPGVPLGIVDPYPMEIVEQDHQILFLYEHFHMVRRIFMDGREAPEGWLPSLVGFSVGRWEDNTLVVETTHMSPDNLMWTSGMPFSGDPETYAIERYNFDGDDLTFVAEVFDPRYYEEPYVMNGHRVRVADGVIFEYECDPRFTGIGWRD